MKKELKKLTIELDKTFENIAKKNLIKRFDDEELDFDSISIYEKLEYIQNEKKRLKKKTTEKATQISLISIASFLLFGF